MGAIVRRGLLLSVSALLGCSGPEARPDVESGPSPTIVSGAAGAEGESEQPSVVFRCEGGRLGAYLVTTASGDDGLFEDQMVPISLDSALGC